MFQLFLKVSMKSNIKCVQWYSIYIYIHIYIYIYIYICFFYSKGMNKKVKMLEHGNMSEFFLSDLY